MDFSKVKSLTIPEGVVTQIADASGRVLWSAKGTAKVTITSVCNGINGDTAKITIVSEGLTYECWEEPNTTIEIPTGSTIECYVTDTKQSNRCYVALNGVNVVTSPGTYTYTVTRDVTIHMEDKYTQGEYGMITITE